MYHLFYRFAALVLLLAAPLSIYAMERVWTRPAGQFRPEATPVVGDWDGAGADEELAAPERARSTA